MQCPVCSVELKRAERQGIEIDHCPQCRGVWLDRGELDKIIERSVVVDPRYVDPNAQYDDDDDDDGSRPYEKKKRGALGSENPSGNYGDDDDDQSRPSGKKRRGGFLGTVFDLFGD
jgi:Zn-finger nucleic acid-binding protein